MEGRGEGCIRVSQKTQDAGLAGGGGGEAEGEPRARSVNSRERDGPRDTRSEGPPLGARPPRGPQAALDREGLG